MPVLDTFLQQKLMLLESAKRRRVLHMNERADGVVVVRGGKRLISFACNDYLGLSSHPKLVGSATEALTKYGAGAGASRLITGNFPLYEELETLLAGVKACEAACVFGSGYLANIGIIPALVGAGDLIISDKLSHACMLDGARLSGASVMRFAHNNVEHLRMLLEANRKEYQNCLIMTETVFSMDGDLAPLKVLAALAKEFDAWLMTDDAHGLGIMKNNPADIQMGTLSKAVGSYGGYVCGSQTLIDYIKNSARSLIYSTALPPATIAASIAALRIIKEEPERVAKPLENARVFTSLLGLEPATSAIVPVIIKDNNKTLQAAALLEEKGFLVGAIRPPTVPENTARLRIAFSALHEQIHIEQLAEMIKQEGWA